MVHWCCCHTHTYIHTHVAGAPLAWMYVLKMEGDTVAGLPLPPRAERGLVY